MQNVSDQKKKRNFQRYPKHPKQNIQKKHNSIVSSLYNIIHSIVRIGYSDNIYNSYILVNGLMFSFFFSFFSSSFFFLLS